MKLYKYLFLIMLATSFVACDKEEDLGESNIIIDDTKNEIDQWIYDHFTKPYNVEIKYEWDDTELENSKVLTPPSLEKIIPFLEVLLEAWVEPYAEFGGEDFVKKMIPKQIILVGSQNMNTNGTMVQGTAEGGRKVVLYQINEFTYSNWSFLKRLMHIMHHEFGHILHQDVLYPEEFKQVTPGGYTAAWMNVSETDALNEGFISPYSKNIIDDDWVEIIAYMLTNSKLEFDTHIKRGNSQGQAILRVKEEMVVNYYQNVWNIDMYALQERIHEVFEMVRLREDD